MMTTGWAAMQPWVRARLYLTAVALSSAFLLLGYKAYTLQVRESGRLRDLAEDQYLRDIELPARRGRILDRNGRELAASVEVDSVYANPRQVEAGLGREAVASTLARALGMEKKELLGRLRSRRYFAWLKRHILPDEARAVRELHLPGIYLTKEPRRYYPGRALGGLVVGWAGLDGRGLEGLELRYDKELRGSPAEVQGLRDALGREVLPLGLGDAAAQAGHDLVTTIDSFIQYRLERALEDGVTKHHARAGSAIALDVQTGEILAMASVPAVDPNHPKGGEPKGAGSPAAPGAPGSNSQGHGARNRPVTDPYEPGSTMKTFTLAGALEAHLVTPDERWFCENGKFQIGSAIIHDAERVGNATTTQVLAESSNICTSKIARRLGRERLDAVLRRFGFAAPTGVDLPGERAGQLRPVRRWGEIELATISFGQGMTATQVQIAAGYAAIANGGTWYRPHAVRRVTDDRGGRVEKAPEGHRVLDEQTARTLRQMLHAVMMKGGTGEKLSIPGYPAAGKTGTAQKVDPLTRRYSTDKWVSSFIGFAPYQAPRLLIMVTVEEPTDTHYGGAVAGPIWREVMVDGLRYLGVTPTEELKPLVPTVAAVAAATPGETGRGPMPTSAGTAGSTAAESQTTATEDDEGPREGGAIDETVDGEADREIPDFTGMSMGEVLDLARRLRLPVELSGSGRAISQSPGPGPAEEGVPCQIHFAPSG
jgi:cell division protein FtsI (penicillin-binding protein 3)